MDKSRILEHRDAILSTIAESSALAPISDDLVAFMRSWLEVVEGRSESAKARTADRSRQIRAGIRLAIGDLPLNARGLAGKVHRRIIKNSPSRYGLRRPPDLATIRAVVREMAAEKK